MGVEPDNEVLLRGRLTADPRERTLPSGDLLVTLRISVPRADDAQARPGADWVDCAVWGGRLRAQARRWCAEDVVEVRGALRRRYFRPAGGGTQTRLEVEAHSGRRVSRATRRG